MKKKLIYSLLLVGVAMSTAQAQGVRIEDSHQKTFIASPADKVSVSNKYGEVVVNTWFSDSVKIVINVAAEGKDRSTANGVMDRVDITLRKIGNRILASTDLGQDKSKSFFGDLMNQITNDSKTGMVGGGRLLVNYEIWMPSDQPLDIENKFGDIYLSSLEGPVTIDLSHGNLIGNSLNGEFVLSHSFGKQEFEYLKDADLTLRSIESKIDKADKLVVESSSSQVRITEVGFARLNSRNDKYQIDKAKDLHMDGSFTDLALNHGERNLRFDFDYGEIYVRKLKRDFERLIIVGKSCDINLILNQASYMSTRIQGQADRMILPNSMLVMHRETLEDGRISLQGEVGNTNTFVSNLDINMNNGKLIISIQETDMFTNR